MTENAPCSGKVDGGSETSPDTSVSGREGRTTTDCASVSQMPLQTALLAPGDCFTVRLDRLFSSISAWSGCRSSVTEITGNSSTRTQARASNDRVDRWHGDSLSWRQMKKAGTTSMSHSRFSRSSMIRN